MALVNQHMTELVPILGPLKTTRPSEYRKAITEIAAEARTLATMQGKNPARAALELDAWRKRIRVELIAAQLASTPTAERSEQLRSAIESRVDADITRHKFEADLAEAAVVRAREHLARAEANRDRTRDNLNRIETNRSARIEARFQALQPRKVAPTAIKQEGSKSPQSNAVPMPAPVPTTALNSMPMPSPAPAGSAVSIPASESLEGGKSR